MTKEGEHSDLDAAKEILAEPRLAALVPSVRLSNIVVSFPCVDDALNHVTFEHAA